MISILTTISYDLLAPKPFQVNGHLTNLSKAFDTYIKHFGYYIQAAGVTKIKEKKNIVVAEEFQYSLSMEIHMKMLHNPYLPFFHRIRNAIKT